MKLILKEKRNKITFFNFLQYFFIQNQQNSEKQFLNNNRQVSEIYKNLLQPFLSINY